MYDMLSVKILFLFFLYMFIISNNFATFGCNPPVFVQISKLKCMIKFCRMNVQILYLIDKIRYNLFAMLALLERVLQKFSMWPIMDNKNWNNTSTMSNITKNRCKYIWNLYADIKMKDFNILCFTWFFSMAENQF